MALSPYEEMVVAELEAQFTGRSGPGVDWARLAVPAALLLGGVALLWAGHHDALLIWVSDLLGFATGAISTALALAGYTVLLGCAFLLGHRTHDVRPSPARPAEAGRPVSPAGRR